MKNTYYENIQSRGGYFAPQGVSHAPMNTKILWRLIIENIKKSFKFHDNKFKTLLLMYDYIKFRRKLQCLKIGNYKITSLYIDQIFFWFQKVLMHIIRIAHKNFQVIWSFSLSAILVNIEHGEAEEEEEGNP